jgi:glycosyltransferase involved in cell wall biosynthesis
MPGGHRILVLSNFFSEGHGGTPESVLLLAGELAACGVAVDVFCNKGLLRDAQMRDALPAMDDAAAFSSVTPDPGSYAALFIAGSWNRRAPLIALRAALAGLPIVYAAKGCLCRAEFERLRDLRRIPYFLLIEWLPLALAGRIVFSSRAEQEACMLPRWFWRRRAVLLPEPFRGDRLGSARPQAGVLTLGFLAEISPRKGLFELIAGLGQYLAVQRGDAVRLKIAGPVRRGAEAYFEECRALAQSNGAAAHIEWCGPVRGAQRRDFYRSLDLFMCPSRFESFGLTPLEALWQGTAVCVAPAVGLLEYLQPDAPVLRLPALGKEDVAAAITDLVSNREVWCRRGRAWEGRHALTRANGEIANDFSHILLTATPA